MNHHHLAAKFSTATSTLDRIINSAKDAITEKADYEPVKLNNSNYEYIVAKVKENKKSLKNLLYQVFNIFNLTYLENKSNHLKPNLSERTLTLIDKINIENHSKREKKSLNE